MERDIVRALGAVYGPYTGTCFASTRETDIEHIVAASEAHDSGLCAADAATKARFARDVRNLTLAAPAVNRYQKSGKDAAEWVPGKNRCWFAGRVVEVRRAYGLTIDRREAAAARARYLDEAPDITDALDALYRHAAGDAMVSGPATLSWQVRSVVQ